MAVKKIVAIIVIVGGVLMILSGVAPMILSAILEAQIPPPSAL